jgi:hypothetical protein
MNELLEKAKRDYPIGTKFRSVFTLTEYICDGYYEVLNKDVYVKEYDSNMVRCIYRTKTNKWAEIIKEETMTQQEFNSLRVGDFISNYEILHKYKDFLIVRCDDGHDLFDLAKINKLNLKIMKNKKYLVIEKEILEKLIKDMIEKTKTAQSDSYLKWLDGNIFALETVKDYCKPLDETI